MIDTIQQLSDLENTTIAFETKALENEFNIKNAIITSAMTSQHAKILCDTFVLLTDL